MTSLAASPVVMHVQLHPGLQPALGHLLPQVDRVLIEVDHLLISVLNVERASFCTNSICLVCKSLSSV